MSRPKWNSSWGNSAQNPRRSTTSLALLLVTSVVLTACTSSTSSPTAAGKQVLLTTEPADASGVVDLKSSLITGLAAADTSVAIVGRVVSGQEWELDRAAFLIRDLQTDSEHDHGAGDHSDCAFCQAKQNDTAAMALVRVTDDAGQVFPTDARQLLSIEEGQVVVAEGKGTIEEDGSLVFAASKIFVRE